MLKFLWKKVKLKIPKSRLISNPQLEFLDPVPADIKGVLFWNIGFYRESVVEVGTYSSDDIYTEDVRPVDSEKSRRIQLLLQLVHRLIEHVSLSLRSDEERDALFRKKQTKICFFNDVQIGA